MTARISHTTVDCTDAYALSTWWKQVLGYVDFADDPNEPGDEECLILDAESGHRLLFVEVPDSDGAVKNSIHLDLRPQSGTRDAELDRLLDLGATVYADYRDTDGPGTGWVTLRDPEGNLFCILRHESEFEVRTD